MSRTLGGKAAIAGIGQTEFSKDSGRSELRLAVEAIRAALDDAGLTPADVDGYANFTIDNNPAIEVVGQNQLGPHVTGSVDVALPGGEVA